MGAPVGNQFWKLRSKHGRDKIFKTPEILLEAACEYFEWCDENPLYEIDFMNCGKGGVQQIDKPKMRAYTLHGLCIYLGVNTIYFNNFETSLSGKNDKISKDFSNVITHIREVLYTQKFSGAAAGFLNPNIIARDLGLRDNQEINHSGRIQIDKTDENL